MSDLIITHKIHISQISAGKIKVKTNLQYKIVTFATLLLRDFKNMYYIYGKTE